MIKHKKIISAILAVVMIGAMSTSVFANGSDSVGPISTAYGNMYGKNDVTSSGSKRTATVKTTCTSNAPRVWVQLGIVSFPSGDSVFDTDSEETANSKSASLSAISYSTEAITSYGAHQIIGSGSWGAYTTVVNA